MVSLFRRALAIPSVHYRRRICLALPLSVAIAVIEAAGFGLLYTLLQALTSDAGVRGGGLITTLYERSGSTDPGRFQWSLGGVICGLLLFRGLCGVALLWWQSTVLTDAEAETSNRLFRAYMHAPLGFHLDTNSAELIRNIQTSVLIVYQNLLVGLVTIASEVSVAVAVAVVLVLADPVIAIGAGVLLGLATLGYTKGLGAFSSRVGGDNQVAMKDIQQQLHEGLGGVKTFQVLGRQDDVSDDFARNRTAWAGTRRSIVFVNQLPRYYLEFVLLVGVAGIAALIAAMGSDRDAAAGVGLLLAAALRMMPSMNKILAALNRAQIGEVATEQVTAEMAAVVELEARAVVAATADSPVVTFTESLVLERVSFTYDAASEPAIVDLDLTIRPGDSVGIVGPSGAGKTTLVDVLLGLLAPQSGRITVDGIDLTEDRLAPWRTLIGYVPQDIFVADASLRRNVALGLAPDVIDDDAVWQALRLANLEDFARSLDDGLDTRMGERGTRFSGGERQRVGIARALYHRPRFLLLDEATSALDGVTEAALSATIASLRGTLTMIVVAHRLSTVRDCDRIVFLADGRVAQVGSFDALAATNDDFAEMVRAGSTGT